MRTVTCSARGIVPAAFGAAVQTGGEKRTGIDLRPQSTIFLLDAEKLMQRQFYIIHYNGIDPLERSGAVKFPERQFK